MHTYIQGKNVQEELTQLVTELPSIFDKVLESLSPLLPAIIYYQSFVQYTTNKWVMWQLVISNIRSCDLCYRSCDEDNFLPMLSYVLKHGNVTVYEWKHGKPPPTSSTSVVNQSMVSVAAESADINWGEEIGWYNFKKIFLKLCANCLQILGNLKLISVTRLMWISPVSHWKIAVMWVWFQ